MYGMVPFYLLLFIFEIIIFLHSYSSLKTTLYIPPCSPSISWSLLSSIAMACIYVFVYENITLGCQNIYINLFRTFIHGKFIYSLIFLSLFVVMYLHYYRFSSVSGYTPVQLHFLPSSSYCSFGHPSLFKLIAVFFKTTPAIVKGFVWFY